MRVRPVPLATAIALLLAASHPALAQQARVYGKVTDGAGSPVAGAKLTLEPLEGAGVTVSTTTGKKGTYMFGLVRPGRYRPVTAVPGQVIRHLEAHATDAERKVRWKLDGAVKPGEPPALDVEEGWVVECDVTLGPAIRMAGGEGKPVLVTPEEAVSDLARRISSGECRSAMPELRRVLEAAPDNATLHYLAGYCAAGEDRADEAIASLTRALALDPALPGASLLRGQVETRVGRNAEAEADFRREIAGDEDPKLLTDTWIALGILYRQQGNDADAVTAFEKVAELAPERPESYSELSALYTRTGQPEKAAALVERAKKAGGLDPAVLLNVGISFLNRKNYAQAAEFFQRAIDVGKKDETEGRAWGLLARCQLNAGNTDEGIASLRRSLELDPQGSLAEENREILSAMEKK